MSRVQDLVGFFLSEEVTEGETLNEYSHSQDNPYFRKVMNGQGDDLARRFELRLGTAKNRTEVEILIQDIEDALEDCGYTENKRSGERAGAYMQGGALVGALAADRGHEGTGALIGMGAGLLAAHFIKDDQKSIVDHHITKLKHLRMEAKDKMLKVK